MKMGISHVLLRGRVAGLRVPFSTSFWWPLRFGRPKGNMMSAPGSMRLPTILTTLVIGLCLCTGARAEDELTREDVLEMLQGQQQVIEQQQQQLERLQGEIEALKATEQQTRAAELELGEEVTEARAEARKALQEVEAIDLARETDRMHTHTPVQLDFEPTRTKFTISGYVKADFITDFREIDSPAKFVTKDIPVPGQKSDEQTTFSANASRFVLGSASETSAGRLTTLVSMDFFGNSTDASPEPRLRQAWGQLDDFIPWVGGSLRMGQSWSSFDDVASLPETLDFEGPNGSDQTRQALVRYERKFGEGYTFWLSAEDPDSSIFDGESKTRLPDWVLSLNREGSWGHIKPAVLLRDVGARGSGGDGPKRHEFGWAGVIAGLINVPWLGGAENKTDNLTFQISYGEGYGSYVNDGYPDGIMDGDSLELLPVFAGSAAYQHWWRDDLRSNAVFGWVDIDNRGAQPDDAVDRTLYTAANVIWSPVERVDLGAEFLWGQRRNKDGRTGHDPRLQFSGKFKF